MKFKLVFVLLSIFLFSSGFKIFESQEELKPFLFSNGDEEVCGTTYIKVPIGLGLDRREESSFYSSANRNRIMNYTFIDTTTMEQHFLFDKNKQLITQTYPIDKSLSKTSVTLAQVFYVVRNDTNKDGELGRNDNFDLLISSPCGKNKKTIATGISDVVVFNSYPEYAVFIYKKGEKAYMVKCDYKKLTILSNTEVKLPK